MPQKVTHLNINQKTMDYKTMTDEQLDKMLKDIQLQQDALEELWHKVQQEKSQRVANEWADKVKHLFNF